MGDGLVHRGSPQPTLTPPAHIGAGQAGSRVQTPGQGLPSIPFPRNATLPGAHGGKQPRRLPKVSPHAQAG